MRQYLAALLCAPLLFAAAPSPDELGEAFRRTELDPAECYRVRDVHFTRHDFRFYLTDGYLIFAKPVAGRVRAAVFVVSESHGEAELLLMPAARAERASLAAFAGSPNLSERFRSALMLFSDDTAEALMERLRARGELVKNPERGLLLAQDWNGILGNLSSSFLVRLVGHMLSGDHPGEGLFYAGISGRTLGNFDVYFDPERPEQIYLGQLKHRDNRAYYDTWTTFPAQPWRDGQRTAPATPFTLSNYRIEAVFEPDLQMRVTTQVTVTPSRPELRVLAFDISGGMRVTAARVNGEEAEIFAPESLRANLMRRLDSSMFLVVPPAPLESGRHYEVVFEHEGRVAVPAGKNVFFVGGRGNWYPQAGIQFARYDITFTYPAGVQIVFPGDVKEDRTEESLRTTRRVTSAPIRIAGFNLGDYEQISLTKDGLAVEIFANREIEESLRLRYRQQALILSPPPSFGGGVRGQQSRRQEILTVPPPPPPDPTARLRVLGDDVASAFSFFAGQFGPPALPSLAVSPIPGSFGQGFPGMVYLSTLAYLDSRHRPGAANSHTQLFFDELLAAHETAHQWWGNVVTSAGPGEEWLMEALANYSALMMLEKKKGAKALNSVLQQYRHNLLRKGETGETLESAGPIRLGLRLRRSQEPAAWNTIIYEKGTWIVHMLRRRMGDERFLGFLGELAQRYRYKGITASEFQALAAEFLPPDAADPELEYFFDSWVNNSGIPKFQLVSTLQGKAPNLRLSLAVRQTGVDKQFTAMVPVVLQISRNQSQTLWLHSADDPEPATIRLRAKPLRIQIDPENSVLSQP